ncbi:MAG: periplasmic heavy metal sensor [Acidobacteriota bacterium]|jgi:Spy/CpxP family protein refolding chaperone|nr:periplasmic heavy metal sensor [Acidobacteriota bacterium]
MRERTRAIAVLLAVLVLGCLVGAAGSWFHYVKHGDAQVDEVDKRRGGPPPQRRERLPQLLGMTSEQETQFEKIMDESRQQLDALRVEQRPKIDAVIEETNRKIQTILNDEQKMKLAAFLADVERERGREGHGGPRDGRGFGPPPPPPRHQSPHDSPAPQVPQSSPD